MKKSIENIIILIKEKILPCEIPITDKLFNKAISDTENFELLSRQYSNNSYRIEDFSEDDINLNSTYTLLYNDVENDIECKYLLFSKKFKYNGFTYEWLYSYKHI